jgi:hypothetical protein
VAVRVSQGSEDEGRVRREEGQYWVDTIRLRPLDCCSSNIDRMEERMEEADVSITKRDLKQI